MKSKKQKWNWLDGLTKRNKPAGITKIKKHNMPDWADSYVYKLSSKKLNKTYIGYHLENGKTYYGSPTDKELILLISDSNSDLVFEIVEYGSKLEMMQLEHDLLVKADARNNPNYWNKTNGQPGVPKFNREAINKIVEIVKSGGDEYLGEPMFPIDLSEIPKNQVREVEYDIDNLNTIVDAIIRNQGSTEKAKPPVILEDRLYEGIEQEVRIGGAHTIQAYCKTKWKNVVKLAPIRIPKKLHEDITDDGITLLGDLLNARKEISSPATHEDGTKYLLKVRQSGRSWKSPEVRTDLFDMGLSSSSVRTAYENADKVIDNETMVGKGYVVKDYVNNKKHQKELEDKIKEVEKYEPDAFVGSSSSAAITWDRIFGRYDEDKKPQHTRIHWLVYNTSRKRQDETWPKLKKKLLKLNRIYGKPVNLSFEELPLYTKEVGKN
jgi:hypothetical protein|tara:strand:- start:198 stop:1505 length:1308 start_codon:yes stop_codon:yes gene_type:complete